MIQHGGDPGSRLLESVVGNVSVALGHGDVLMSQQLLDGEETSSAPDSHARERVAEVVDAEVLDSRKLTCLVEGITQVVDVAFRSEYTCLLVLSLGRLRATELYNYSNSFSRESGREPIFWTSISFHHRPHLLRIVSSRTSHEGAGAGLVDFL